MSKRRVLAAMLAASFPLISQLPASPASMHDVTYLTSGSPVVAEDSASVRIRIHRGEHGLKDATVFYGTGVGSATEGDDYRPRDGKVVMGAPSDDRSVGIPLIDDDVVEDVEDFQFRLNRAEGGTVLRVPTTATVTIADDDGPSRISFARGTFSNFENRGSIAVTMVRSGDSSLDASAELVSTGAGAVDGTDYSGVSQTVTFASVDRAEVVFMPLINDSEGEATEEIALSLGSPVGGSLAGPETAAAQILDDDSASSDTKAPVTQFHRPRHGSVYKSKRFRTLHVITSDDASGVATLKGALRRKLLTGKCGWHNGKKFVRGGCDNYEWNKLEVRPFVYWWLRGKLNPTTRTTGVKNYTAYALAIDEAGNAESILKKGRNKNTFRIK
jgi:Calx-beta domain-containing protein